MLHLSLLLLSGIFAGLLAGLFGVGGGIVLVPVLIFILPFFGVEASALSHVAVATSLASIIFTGSSSAFRHHRFGALDWPLVVRLVPSMVIGALAGAWISGFFSSQGLQILIAMIMLLAAARLLTGSKMFVFRSNVPSYKVLSAVGAAIGTLSALCGIGGGSFTVPFLAGCSVPLRRAVAVSSACGVPVALIGTVGYLGFNPFEANLGWMSVGPVVWPAVGIIVMGSLVFAQVGASLAHRLPIDILRRGFGLLLAVVAIRMLF